MLSYSLLEHRPPQRLLEPIGYVPPLEHERGYYRQQQLSPAEAGLN